MQANWTRYKLLKGKSGWPPSIATRWAYTRGSRPIPRSIRHSGAASTRCVPVSKRRRCVTLHENCGNVPRRRTVSGGGCPDQIHAAAHKGRSRSRSGQLSRRPSRFSFSRSRHGHPNSRLGDLRQTNLGLLRKPLRRSCPD
jgi:hypothetical protein